MSDNKESFGKKITLVAKEYFGNQKKMAEFLGLHQANITEWIKGRTTPTLDTIQKICDKTGVSMDWLVLDRDEPYVDEVFFEEVFDAVKNFAKENNIEFDSYLLLAIQRIIMAEKRDNKNITIKQVFNKYTDIILTLRKK